jgi:hypothetical protein
MGRHDELLDDSPIYAEIYRSQLVSDGKEQAAEGSRRKAELAA